MSDRKQAKKRVITAKQRAAMMAGKKKAACTRKCEVRVAKKKATKVAKAGRSQAQVAAAKADAEAKFGAWRRHFARVRADNPKLEYTSARDIAQRSYHQKRGTW